MARKNSHVAHFSPATVSNLLVMERYKQLVVELYIEAKEEQILGSFLERDPENQVATEKDGQNNPPGEKEPHYQRKQTGSGMKDIRSFFSPVQREKGPASDVVTIDWRVIYVLKFWQKFRFFSFFGKKLAV